MTKRWKQREKLVLMLVLCLGLMLCAVACDKQDDPSELVTNGTETTPTSTATTASTETTTEATTAPTESTTEPTEITTEPVEVIDFDNLVTDAYVDVIQHGEASYCYHIPQINLSGEGIAELNQKIYDHIYGMMETDVYSAMSEYGEPGLYTIRYDWGLKDDLLSIVIRAGVYHYEWTDYFVYTASMDSREEVSAEEVYAVYGLTEDSYYALAREVLQSHWDERIAAMNGVDMEWIQTLVDATLAEENLEKNVPFINARGELCMVANIYSPAGAEYYSSMVNMATKTIEEWPDCAVDHSVG